jgi:hypothetical protein
LVSAGRHLCRHGDVVDESVPPEEAELVQRDGDQRHEDQTYRDADLENNLISIIVVFREAGCPTGENLEVVRAEFSALS